MNKKTYISLLFAFSTLLLFWACEKEISIDLPDAEIKLVVEGKIEPNLPPLIILTKSVGYFAPTDVDALNNLFVHDAVITVQTDTSIVTLTEFCTSDIPDSLLPYLEDFMPAISAATGIPVELLSTYNYCIYSTSDFSVWGKYGKTYTLSINSENKNYSAVTSIPQAIPLDSLWFEAKTPGDSLGYIWATLSDPAGLGNNYRWFAKRPSKDNSFIAPIGSAFEDRFVDGQTFNFGYNRGRQPNSTAEDDNNRERGAYKINDTIIVKFCTIDKGTFEFIRDFETDVANNGNPFGAPGSIKTNISGGALGYWGGYGVSFDTLIVKP